MIYCLKNILVLGCPRIVRQNRRNRKSYYEKLVLFQLEYRDVAKTVPCETILHNIRGMILKKSLYYIGKFAL